MVNAALTCPSLLQLRPYGGNAAPACPQWGESAAIDTVQLGRSHLQAALRVYSLSGDQAGSEAKFGVGIDCSLRPVRSMENSFGPPAPGTWRKNMM